MTGWREMLSYPRCTQKLMNSLSRTRIVFVEQLKQVDSYGRLTFTKRTAKRCHMARFSRIPHCTVDEEFLYAFQSAGGVVLRCESLAAVKDQSA